MDVRVGLERKVSTKKLMLLNYGIGEDSLTVPGTARRPIQSILKEISSEYSVERLMLKLKLQHFGHLMQRADSLEKNLMLGKIDSRRRRGQQRMRWLDGITDSMDVSLSKLGSWWWTGKPGMLQSMGLQRVWHDWATELNWVGVVSPSWEMNWFVFSSSTIKITSSSKTNIRQFCLQQIVQNSSS